MKNITIIILSLLFLTSCETMNAIKIKKEKKNEKNIYNIISTYCF